ncbi:MAG: alpha/beta fold hydrolase [Chloroflexi bacterium]|nr:alpha/beta fold hydrolase [Chloroflexota bacterium]
MRSEITGAEHWVVSNGHRLYLWEKRQATPDSSAHVTLLVHGSTYSGPNVFDVQVPGKDYSMMDFLARSGHDVFTFAVWGYGRSDRPEDGFAVTTEAALQDIAAVVDAIQRLRGVKAINLLGWSWGGRTTALFTSRHPEAVERLVLYAGGAGNAAGNRPEPTEPWNIITRENIMARIEQDCVIPDAQEEFIRNAVAIDRKAPVRKGTGAPGEPPSALPEAIRVPTHIIYGARDGGYQAERVADFFARLATPDKALTVYPDAGHFLFIQKPRLRFFHAVDQFFRLP